MEKKRKRLSVVIFTLAAVSIRILYFFLKKGTITDTYEYFAHAMIELEKKEPLLTSGLAYAYTENLSDLLGFVGNRIEPVAVYQMVLQIFWLIVFFLGMQFLCGTMGGLVAGGILAVSPWVLGTLHIVGPENYFMLAFSLWLLALGYFYKRTKIHGWYRSNGCELYLMFAGFFLGVICTWNYVGWLLVLLTAYVLTLNHRNLEDRLWEQKQKEELDEKYQLMPVYSQAFILVLGLLIGMYATLMKYTGITGIPVGEQFIWWLEQYKALPGRCQDLSVSFALWTVLAVLMGIVVEYIEKFVRKKKLIQEMYDEEEKLTEESDSEIDKPKDEASVEANGTALEDNYIVTEDGRTIKLLDNPLPVPKKHVKKEMEFKIDSTDEQSDEKLADDFDYHVDDNDDFDV